MLLNQRLQVLVLLALTAPTAAPTARAQPADVPNPISAPQPAPDEQNGEPRVLPLLPIALDDWLKANGGLSRLKFKLDNATAFEIADEVREQTGIELAPDENLRRGDGGQGEEARRFSVEATGQTFWEAVSQWNRPAKPDAGQIYLQRDWQSRDIWQLAMWSNLASGRTLQIGPALMIASSLSLNRSRYQSLLPQDDPKTNPTAKAPDERESMSLSTAFRIDPKLSPLVLGLITQIDSVTDDKGRAIAVEESYQSPWFDNDNFYLSLKAPAPEARRIASIKGTLRLGVLTKREHWEIELPDTPDEKFGAEKSFKSAEAEVKMRLGPVARRLNSWSIGVHLERRDIGPSRAFRVVTRDNGNMARLGDTNDTTHAIRVLNAAGKPLPSDGGNSYQTEKNGVRILDTEVNIQDEFDEQKPEDLAPAKIIIEVPMEWREIQIPFELTDLPLP